MRVLHMPVEGIIAGSLGEDMRATADTLVRSRKFLLPARTLSFYLALGGDGIIISARDRAIPPSTTCPMLANDLYDRIVNVKLEYV